MIANLLPAQSSNIETVPSPKKNLPLAEIKTISVADNFKIQEGQAVLIPAATDTKKRQPLARISHSILKPAIGYVSALAKSDINTSKKATAESGYPQINKAGFILIGAGVLAIILHLIIYACIALMVLGLIILIAPLFHKRY